ncbi:MAG: hypothetical protein JSR29_05535 [Nitrospira sp.]|nr:hypothetical protein [Nitrospira sp.]
MSNRFNEIGFTLQEENTFWEELKKVGLLPGVNEKKTRFEIVTYLVDLHDNLVLSSGEIQRRLEAMQDGLETFLQAYAQEDTMSEALKLHLADHWLLPPNCAECARREQQAWEELVSASTPVEGPGFKRRDMDRQPDENRYLPERYVAELLAGVQQARMQKIPTSRRYAVFKLAMWKLLEIFERDTGIYPKVHSNEYREDGISGNACEFLIACLTPTNLVKRKVLGSNIYRAYKEWHNERRSSPHTPSPT